MITAAIIINACYFSIVVAMLLFAFLTKVKKSDYDVMTSTNRGILTFAIIFTTVNSAIIILGLVLLIIYPNRDYFMLLPAIGTMFGLLGSTLLSSSLIQFEAVKDRTIYVRRFIKIKKIPIDDVYSVDRALGMRYIISDKFGDKLFSMDTITYGRAKFFKTINERKTKYIISDVLEIDSSFKEERVFNDVLLDIGKQYRKNYYKKRKRYKICGIVGLIVSAIVILETILIIYKLGMGIPLALNTSLIVTTVFGIFNIRRRLNQMQHEISKDNEWVGAKHKYEDKRVIGHHKYLAKNIAKYLLAIAIVSIPSGTFTLPIAHSHNPYKEEELVSVYGKVDYTGILMDGSYVIAFEDNPVEYQIDSKFLSYADPQLFSIEAGTNVYLFTDNREALSMKAEKFRRSEYKKFYVIKAPLSTVFISYESYYKVEMRSKANGLALGYTFLGIGTAALIAIPIICLTVGTYKKNEYIIIKD